MNLPLAAAIMMATWCLTSVYIARLVCDVVQLAVNRAHPCDLGDVLLKSAALADKAINRRKDPLR